MGWKESLQGKGLPGKALVWFLTNAIAPYVAVGAILSSLLTIWGYAHSLVSNPDVQLGAEIFLFMLWTYIGLLFLLDRRNPRVVKSSQDLAYGLIFEGLAPAYDQNNKDETLNFAIQLRNFSPSPLKYFIRDCVVKIGTRTVDIEDDKLTAVMARGAGRVSSPTPFKYDDIKEFFGKRVKGTLKFIIVYGHPEKSLERRLTVNVDITLEFTQEGFITVFGNDIRKELDEPI